MTKNKVKKQANFVDDEPENKEETIMNELVDRGGSRLNNAVEKPNKKIEALESRLGLELEKLYNFLKQQGLGQNAIQKVIELVNVVNVTRDLIAKESE